MVTGKRRCTGFFCMDENFFNHLGPFFETTPSILPSTREDDGVTEKSRISSVHDNEVTWRPTEKSQILVSNEVAWRSTTEKSQILPKVVNNDVTWSPTEKEPVIYEEYSYDYDQSAEYEWRPYDPTVSQVNATVDELTAPSSAVVAVNANETISDNNLSGIAKNDVIQLQEDDPEALPFLQNFNYDYYELLEEKEEPLSCPSKRRCRCVCEDEMYLN